MARQQAYTLYKIDNKNSKIQRKNQECPRCRGAFLAEHKNRRACGHCGYSEYKR